jgi:hypothetical protein
MHEVEAQRLRHGVDFISGFQPSVWGGDADLGLPAVGLGWNVVGPSGLGVVPFVSELPQSSSAAAPTVFRNRIFTRGHYA